MKDSSNLKGKVAKKNYFKVVVRAYHEAHFVAYVFRYLAPYLRELCAAALQNSFTIE